MDTKSHHRAAARENKVCFFDRNCVFKQSFALQNTHLLQFEICVWYEYRGLLLCKMSQRFGLKARRILLHPISYLGRSFAWSMVLGTKHVWSSVVLACQVPTAFEFCFSLMLYNYQRCCALIFSMSICNAQPIIQNLYLIIFSSLQSLCHCTSYSFRSCRSPLAIGFTRNFVTRPIRNS